MNKTLYSFCVSISTFIVLLVIGHFSMDDFRDDFVFLCFVYILMQLMTLFTLNWKNGFIINFISANKLKPLLIVFVILYLLASVYVFCRFKAFDRLMFIFCLGASISACFITYINCD